MIANAIRLIIDYSIFLFDEGQLFTLFIISTANRILHNLFKYLAYPYETFDISQSDAKVS